MVEWNVQGASQREQLFRKYLPNQSRRRSKARIAGKWLGLDKSLRGIYKTEQASTLCHDYPKHFFIKLKENLKKSLSIFCF